MKKALKIILVLFVVLAVLVLTSRYYLGAAIRTAVLTVGPRLTGVEIQLDHLLMAPLQGKLELRGLVVGNPEGFKSQDAIKLGHILVEFEPGSLLKEKVEVTRVVIDQPVFTFEGALSGSNIKRILDNMGGGGAEEPIQEEPLPEPEPSPEEDVEAAPGKLVVIRDLVVNEAVINLSATFMDGKVIPIPLPSIHMVDIGEERETTITDSLRLILEGILEAILGAVGKTPGAVVSGAGGAAGGVSDAIESGASAVGKGVEKIAEGFQGLFKRK